MVVGGLVSQCQQRILYPVKSMKVLFSWSNETNFYSSNPELLLTKLQLTKFDEVLGWSIRWLITKTTDELLSKFLNYSLISVNIVWENLKNVQSIILWWVSIRSLRRDKKNPYSNLTQPHQVNWSGAIRFEVHTLPHKNHSMIILWSKFEQLKIKCYVLEMVLLVCFVRVHWQRY